MSETKLTLEEAKAEIENERRLSHYNCARVEGLSIALNILARVEQPSEEGMAVLWLMREKGWVFRYRRSRSLWEQQIDPQFDDWVDCNPVEEAKKLGWGW